MALKFTKYADVQAALTGLVSANGLSVGQAPHGAFWNNLSYQDFITGNVPSPNGVIPGGPYKILIVGNAAESTIIMALSGTGSVFGPDGNIGQMPQPSPPYNSQTPTQSDVIAALTAWINEGCPNPV